MRMGGIIGEAPGKRRSPGRLPKVGGAAGDRFDGDGRTVSPGGRLDDRAGRRPIGCDRGRSNPWTRGCTVAIVVGICQLVRVGSSFPFATVSLPIGGLGLCRSRSALLGLDLRPLDCVNTGIKTGQAPV